MIFSFSFIILIFFLFLFILFLLGEKIMQETKENWTTIEIQDLLPKPLRVYEIEHPKHKWCEKKCLHNLPSYYPASLKNKEECKCQIMTYVENIEVNTHLISNPFYDAFITAYNNHNELILSPDDMWIQISLQFGCYINEHAEEMRSFFVLHEGKKFLEVHTKEQESEEEWDEFFTLMLQEIEKNTKNQVVDDMVCKFSTTGHVEKLFSTAIIMDSFQKYFEYGRCIDGCGITKVHFLGSLFDWESLLKKTKNLAKYAVNKKWIQFIEGLIPVIEKFIATYKNDVDVRWWNQVTNFELGRLGSGTTHLISGWILKFFYGLSSDKVDVDEIKSRAINVPIKVFFFHWFFNSCFLVDES